MIAMQTRCIHCGREQYAIAVSKVSRGLMGCVWCGEYSVEMSEDEYRERMRILREKQKREYDNECSINTHNN